MTRYTSSPLLMPAPCSTKMSGSISLTARIAAETYSMSLVCPVPINPVGSATMILGLSFATAADSAAVSVQTMVASPTSSARRIVCASAEREIGFSQWLSITPFAPAATSDSGKVSASPLPGTIGSICGAKTKRRSVAAATRLSSTIGVVKMMSTSYFFEAASAASASASTSSP
ncbi:hypothetical protein SDC9_147356 [bioreactor metagenome]|uniref:Uncharacterized protein n=1 Tax=bioreactor metagenome TaxID=1076179 RepID=A0A645EFV1_9ZZZZ